MFRRTKRPSVRREADRRLARVGLVSVGLVSFIVAVLTAAMIFLAGIVLWRYGVGTGVVERAEEIIGNFTADGTFALDGATLFAGWLAVSAMWAVALTVLGVVVGVIVNFACFVTGGIRLKFRWYAPARPQVRAQTRPQGETEIAGQQQLDLDGVTAPGTASIDGSRPAVDDIATAEVSALASADPGQAAETGKDDRAGGHRVPAA